jgi:hypothetical protein
MRLHLTFAALSVTLLTILSAPANATAKPPEPSAPAAPSAPTAPPTRGDVDRAANVAKAPVKNAAGFVGDPYPLDTCIVAGEKLGADAVTVVLKDQKDPVQEGRQLKFCCQKCVAKFEANPGEYLAKLDAEIIKKQRDSYPLDYCIAMPDEKLGEDAQAFVVGNRCYVTCCKKCTRNMQKGAARYVMAYEKAVMAKQSESYPVDTCVVSGEKLGTKTGDKRYDFVVGQRLVRTCCEDCAKKVLENPAKYLAKLDTGKPGTSEGEAKK